VRAVCRPQITKTAEKLWRKLHFTSPDVFDVDKMQENIRIIQELGIEIMFHPAGSSESFPAAV
jgi:hypothetical protein